MTVKKRNGDIEEFDTKKIERAIMAAAKSAKVEVSSEILEKLVKFVTSKVSKLTEPIEIEDIQNIVDRTPDLSEKDGTG